jgi:hypothetical protein
MSKGYVRVDIRKPVAELLWECKEEYLKHNPQMRGVFVSRNKLIRQICLYYLGRRPEERLEGEDIK